MKMSMAGCVHGALMSFMVAATGCTTQVTYDGISQSRRAKCESLTGPERIYCLRGGYYNDGSYRQSDTEAAQGYVRDRARSFK